MTLQAATAPSEPASYQTTASGSLKENRPKISAACNQVLKNHGQ